MGDFSDRPLSRGQRSSSCDPLPGEDSPVRSRRTQSQPMPIPASSRSFLRTQQELWGGDAQEEEEEEESVDYAALSLALSPSTSHALDYLQRARTPEVREHKSRRSSHGGSGGRARGKNAKNTKGQQRRNAHSGSGGKKKKKPRKKTQSEYRRLAKIHSREHLDEMTPVPLAVMPKHESKSESDMSARRNTVKAGHHSQPDEELRAIKLVNKNLQTCAGVFDDIIHAGRGMFVERILLYRNALTSLSNDFQYFTSLRHLSLNQNRLGTNANMSWNLIWKLKSLTNLNLGQNKISGALPAGIRALSSLKTLQLSGNELDSLSDEICELKDLEKLYCDKNQLRALPDNLLMLPSLCLLHAQSNRLETLPERVHQRSKLKTMKLRFNNLRQLPKSWFVDEESGEGLLRALENFDVHGNYSLIVPPQSQARCLQDIRYFFRASASTSGRDFLPASSRVICWGSNAELTRQVSTSLEKEIEAVTDLDEAPDVYACRLNVAHELLLHGLDSVHIIVVERSASDDFEGAVLPWVEIIHAHAPGAPVFLHQTRGSGEGPIESYFQKLLALERARKVRLERTLATDEMALERRLYTIHKLRQRWLNLDDAPKILKRKLGMHLSVRNLAHAILARLADMAASSGLDQEESKTAYQLFLPDAWEKVQRYITVQHGKYMWCQDLVDHFNGEADEHVPSRDVMNAVRYFHSVNLLHYMSSIELIIIDTKWMVSLIEKLASLATDTRTLHGREQHALAHGVLPHSALQPVLETFAGDISGQISLYRLLTQLHVLLPLPSPTFEALPNIMFFSGPLAGRQDLFYSYRSIMAVSLESARPIGPPPSLPWRVYPGEFETNRRIVMYPYVPIDLMCRIYLKVVSTPGMELELAPASTLSRSMGRHWCALQAQQNRTGTTLRALLWTHDNQLELHVASQSQDATVDITSKLVSISKKVVGAYGGIDCTEHLACPRCVRDFHEKQSSSHTDSPDPQWQLRQADFGPCSKCQGEFTRDTLCLTPPERALVNVESRTTPCGLYKLAKTRFPDLGAVVRIGIYDIHAGRVVKVGTGVFVGSKSNHGDDVGPSLIMTAAHVLYEDRRGMRFKTAKYDQNGKPILTCRPRQDIKILIGLYRGRVSRSKWAFEADVTLAHGFGWQLRFPDGVRDNVIVLKVSHALVVAEPSHDGGNLVLPTRAVNRSHLLEPMISARTQVHSFRDVRDHAQKVRCQASQLPKAGREAFNNAEGFSGLTVAGWPAVIFERQQERGGNEQKTLDPTKRLVKVDGGIAVYGTDEGPNQIHNGLLIFRDVARISLNSGGSGAPLYDNVKGKVIGIFLGVQDNPQDKEVRQVLALPSFHGEWMIARYNAFRWDLHDFFVNNEAKERIYSELMCAARWYHEFLLITSLLLDGEKRRKQSDREIASVMGRDHAVRKIQACFDLEGYGPDQTSFATFLTRHSRSHGTLSRQVTEPDDYTVFVDGYSEFLRKFGPHPNRLGEDCNLPQLVKLLHQAASGANTAQFKFACAAIAQKYDGQRQHVSQ